MMVGEILVIVMFSGVFGKKVKIVVIKISFDV